MERIEVKGENYIRGYHTQESREYGFLTKAIKCTNTDAWLGAGFYFWTELEFAKYWGIDSKKVKSPMGCYDVYSSIIKEENLLNTVFDEEHYFYFIEMIDLAIEKIKTTGISHHLSLNKVNRYLTDNIWNATGFTGIIFEDIPSNVPLKKRIYSVIPPLYYVKRIQIVVFDEKIITNFEMLLEEQV